VAIYGCIAVIVLRQMAHRRLAVVIALLCCCVPPIVAVSRVYRGMHYTTDVLFGALGGGLWLLVAVLVVVPSATYGRGARRAPRHASTDYELVGRDSTGATSSLGVRGSSSGGGGSSSTSSSSSSPSSSSGAASSGTSS
jgi:uncharacterized membrane protein YgcG